ncbi:uncharacterized protein FOMMEDRAFT_154651 [Fomitiporia mediterranea MF3/22]|uniref:uncharacterized protein n=1 Tax=Fomitiporia mediterranea (strain MF3/22) TaxID=694068 RepID=UPI000440856C|nr:uncharacterized protein FOMMEDRAFT_154651 [Fomitiporia mediterranea MF3/22]EJD03571.1 hypothetical protein FOMMEDRAFT_154651 [Fomitiporia mediterranea MF3/22]
MKLPFRLRLGSRGGGTGIISGRILATLVKNLSEVANFGPTKCAADIALSMLDTAQEIRENKVACLLLVSRAVDFLLQLRDLSESHPSVSLDSLQLKMQELEMELDGVHSKMKHLLGRTFMQRIHRKEETEYAISACEYRLETAFNSFQVNNLII